jgi:hypothetical protein
VDETSLTRPYKRGDRTFYATAAVTFARESLDMIRDELLEIAGDDYWHATEAYSLGRYDQIIEMAEHVRSSAVRGIVAVEMPLTEGGSDDDARETCIAALATEITKGTGDGMTRLIVAERNKKNKLNNYDQATLHSLRKARDIYKDVSLYHASMRDEPLLWAADLAAWSTYRVLAVDDTRWIDPLRDVLTFLDARTGTPIPLARSNRPGRSFTAQNFSGKVARARVAAGPDANHNTPAEVAKRAIGGL